MTRPVVTKPGSCANSLNARRGRLSRRQCLAVIGACTIAPVTLAHTPFQQWVVYRKKHLLIGSSKDDINAGSYAHAKYLVSLLAQSLPAAKSRPTRAPSVIRLASLLTTEQLHVVLLRPDTARQLREGSPPFTDYGPFDLRLIMRSGEYLLVAHPQFPDHHAWLLANAVSTAEAGADKSLRTDDSVPLHRGAKAFFDGEPVPAAPIRDDHPETPHGHD